MIYLDSSAALKLIVREAETDAVRDWLTARATTPRVTSALARVEVLRGMRRVGATRLRDAERLLDGFASVPLDDRVLTLAASVGSPFLRSLDAIHLASAMILGDAVEAFVAYDRRLLEAAADAGLPILSPA